MGEKANDIAVLLGLTTEEVKEYNTVKEKIESHFVICSYLNKRNLISASSQEENQLVIMLLLIGIVLLSAVNLALLRTISSEIEL